MPIEVIHAPEFADDYQRQVRAVSLDEMMGLEG
jgi:hypothetical protein